MQMFAHALTAAVVEHKCHMCAACRNQGKINLVAPTLKKTFGGEINPAHSGQRKLAAGSASLWQNKTYDNKVKLAVVKINPRL